MSKHTLHEIVSIMSKNGKVTIGYNMSGLPSVLVSLGLCKYTTTTTFMDRPIYSLVPTSKWSDLMTNWLKANYKELKSDGK